MGNPVHWAHIIEDEDALNDLRGGEMVFTSGVQDRGGDWLVKFAGKLAAAGASTLAVCLGPHVPELPPALIKTCDEAGLPLFTLPREARAADVTRDFCRRILRSEQAEESVASLLKNILLRVGDAEAQALPLERHGCRRDSRFTFVAAGADGEDWQEAAFARIEEAAARLREPLTCFAHKDARVMVLVNCGEAAIDAFVRGLLQTAEAGPQGLALRLGVSPTREGLANQALSFERALAALRMARRRGEAAVYYDRLGFDKLLCAVEDRSVLPRLLPGDDRPPRSARPREPHRADAAALRRSADERQPDPDRRGAAHAPEHRRQPSSRRERFEGATGRAEMEECLFERYGASGNVIGARSRHER